MEKKFLLAFSAYALMFAACGDDSSSTSATSIESSSSESYEGLDESSSSTKAPKPTEESSSSATSSSSVESSSSVVESSSSTPIEDPDDKSDDLLSCDQKSEWTVFDVTFTSHICAEAINTAEYRERLDEICVPTEDGVVTKIKGTGCPSEAKKVCEGQKEGTFMYFYDEDDAHKSCEELMVQFDGSGENDSGNNEDSSSVSDDLFACEFKYDFTINGDPSAGHNCIEVSPKFKKTLDNVCHSFESTEGPMIGSQTAIKMASCPSGAKKVCESEGQVWYHYDEDAAQKTCEEL